MHEYPWGSHQENYNNIIYNNTGLVSVDSVIAFQFFPFETCVYTANDFRGLYNIYVLVNRPLSIESCIYYVEKSKLELEIITHISNSLTIFYLKESLYYHQ